MPVNLQAILLILVFIVPGFVFVEVDARLRPAQKLGAFDRTVVSVLFSTILHGFVVWLICVVLWFISFDLAKLFDATWLADWSRKHTLLVYTSLLSYFLLSMTIAIWCGARIGILTRGWMPVILRVVEKDKINSVLVQMKNGDFFTGLLDKIPADYDVLQSPAKDFTIRAPGRYKPKGQPWQNREETEVILLNTSNVDAIRVMKL